MVLTEKEKEVLMYLINPFPSMGVGASQGGRSPVYDLSNEEIVSLYKKMDTIMEYEGDVRRSFGIYDEMYVLLFSGVKDTLLREIEDRGLNISNSL